MNFSRRKILALTSGAIAMPAKRSELASEFPTMAESGVPGFDVLSSYSIYVPAKTPPDIVKKLNADIVSMLGEPAIMTRLAPLGVEVAGSTPAESGAKVRAETELWGSIIKASNIKGE